MKRGLLIIVLLALLAMVAACGGSEEADTGAEQAATTQPAAQQAQPSQQQAATPTAKPPAPTNTPAPPTPTPEPEEEVLTAEQLAALEGLDSYRAVVTYTSQGTDADGNAMDDTGEIITEFTKDPPARRMVISFTDNTDPSADLSVIEAYQIGNDMYMKADEEMGWLRISTDESPFDDPSMSLLTGGNVFSNLDTLKRVRPDEKINGIDSRHYRFDEQALLPLLSTDITEEGLKGVTASGDVWIAKDGGFVTRYEFTVEIDEGNGGLLNPGMTNGTMTMTFELQDVNSKDLVIELPEQAATSLSGFEEEAFPAPEGSTTQMASSTIIVLESDLPLEEILAFYESALADQGWTKSEEESMSFGGMSSLTFTKDGQTLSLLITTDESTGMAQIMANVEQSE